MRAEIHARCPRHPVPWSRLGALEDRVACPQCEHPRRVEEEQLVTVVRKLHGAADLGGGEGLHPLRWLSIWERNPHRDLGVTKVSLSVEIPAEEGKNVLDLRLEVAQGNPLCAVCGASLFLARSPSQRAAGVLQCRSCKSTTPSSSWRSSFARIAPLRAMIEEREESEEDGEDVQNYREMQPRRSAVWWFCFEGPSWERMQIEQSLLRDRGDLRPGARIVWPWLYLGAAFSGASLMMALRPPRWIPPSQVIEMRGIGLFLFLLGTLFTLGPAYSRMKALPPR